jgi:type I site-specific restriction endonuclease
MNPEDRARQDIDRQLGQCGWAVQDRCPKRRTDTGFPLRKDEPTPDFR